MLPVTVEEEDRYLEETEKEEPLPVCRSSTPRTRRQRGRTCREAARSVGQVRRGQVSGGNRKRMLQSKFSLLSNKGQVSGGNRKSR